jgi:hypothetical protein
MASRQIEVSVDECNSHCESEPRLPQLFAAATGKSRTVKMVNGEAAEAALTAVWPQSDWISLNRR